MRLFIAISLPAEIKEAIAAIQTQLKKCDCAARWVKPDNMHITLKFLGEVSQEKIGGIKKAIENVSEKHASLSLKLEGFGFFPNEKRPRVLFISTSGQEILKSIADELEAFLERLGFKREGRFHSHITLARLKQLKNIESLRREIKNIAPEGSFQIKEILLYESKLTKTGPIYEIIARIALAA